MNIQMIVMTMTDWTLGTILILSYHFVYSSISTRNRWNIDIYAYVSDYATQFVSFNNAYLSKFIIWTMRPSEAFALGADGSILETFQHITRHYGSFLTYSSLH